MLELRIINGAQAMPLFDLPMLLGRKEAAREVGDQIEALIAFMDELGGDPDLEANGDDEPDADDAGDQSWPEGYSIDGRGMSMLGGQFYEDAEDDDPDCCTSGDDVGSSETSGFAKAPWWLANAAKQGRAIGDAADAEEDDHSGTICGDDLGTNHRATIKMSAEWRPEADEDAEPKFVPEMIGGGVIPAHANQ